MGQGRLTGRVLAFVGCFVACSEFLPPPPRPGSQSFEAARAADGHARAIERQAMLDRNDHGVSELSRKRGTADRLRSVLLRGNSSRRPRGG
jgi:hypothetical protein